MKVIGVACSCLPRSNSMKTVEAFLKGAAEAGHETELIKLDKDLRGCIGCQGCKKGEGFCVQKDDMTRYFELLPEAGAVVLGAGNYMGWPQGEAWTFMNRHYCLTKGVGEDRVVKIEPGKWFFSVFAQGSPDEAFYTSHYEALIKPFEGWGFKCQPPFVVTRASVDDKVAEAYELGKAL
jgi:multimeric flavodoxin WrbA